MSCGSPLFYLLCRCWRESDSNASIAVSGYALHAHDDVTAGSVHRLSGWRSPHHFIALPTIAVLSPWHVLQIRITRPAADDQTHALRERLQWSRCWLEVIHYQSSGIERP
jgi:hypothetical protein